jgi:DNA-binding NarL/FixJ family response regulator
MEDTGNRGVVVERIKVLLADDHAVVRSGLSKILELEPSIEIVGEAKDGIDTINKAEELKPDIILMDILMPRCNGLEAMASIHEKLPGTKVLFLTVSDNEEDLFKAIRSGAQGYILKSSSVNELLEAVKRTAAGESMLSPGLATRLIAKFRSKDEADNKLSDREKEVLNLVGKGLTNSEIAERLFIGESTVRTHLQRLLYKLNLKNRAEAIAYSARHS